jgi:hypothetical protein
MPGTPSDEFDVTLLTFKTGSFERPGACDVALLDTEGGSELLSLPQAVLQTQPERATTREGEVAIVDASKELLARMRQDDHIEDIAVTNGSQIKLYRLLRSMPMCLWC